MERIIVKLEPEWNHAHCALACDYDLPGWAQIPERLVPFWKEHAPFVSITVDETGVITDMDTAEEIIIPDQLPELTVDERLSQLETITSDTDSMVVDQEYRLTLLELGVNE